MKEFNEINKTEYTLLKYLTLSLQPSGKAGLTPSLSKKEWEQLISLADRHEVLPLLQNVLDPDGLPEEQGMYLQTKTARTVQKSIRLQVLNARLTALLEKEGIVAVTLKGSAVSRFYPVPEFRKTTDIDLFVEKREQAKKAVRLLCDNGFVPSSQWHANHHFVLTNQKKEVVELHTSWAEIFKEKQLNQYLGKLQKESNLHCRPVECQGLKVYAYEISWQGLYLLLHMLQHFVASGFGLRNLCDWVVLWEHCDDPKERKEFWKMACESGTAGFAGAVSAVCVSSLGLSPEKSPVPAKKFPEQEVVDAFLKDILDAGEFGYSEEERMVGMDGNSILSYGKEFHHQMHINFPKAGKVAVFWPVLWIATLIRFLNNNKRLNRAPVSKIMKKAGKRGKLVKRLTSPKA